MEAASHLEKIASWLLAAAEAAGASAATLCRAKALTEEVVLSHSRVDLAKKRADQQLQPP